MSLSIRSRVLAPSFPFEFALGHVLTCRRHAVRPKVIVPYGRGTVGQWSPIVAVDEVLSWVAD